MRDDKMLRAWWNIEDIERAHVSDTVIEPMIERVDDITKDENKSKLLRDIESIIDRGVPSDDKGDEE
jgi:hypothetical protein